MTSQLDCVVIGAGVVGLACARALALQGHETIVVEAETLIGSGTSSRNSEVIHAGIYYPTGSLKARLCVRGKQLLYDYCEQHGVAHRRCGKLIVATGVDQLPALAAIREKAAGNGVTDLMALTGERARVLEPNLSCIAALQSPSTGIVDSHGLMLSLQGDLESAGGMVAFASPVLSADCRAEGMVLRIGGGQPSEVLARTVVNSSGLAAGRLAARFEGLAARHVPPSFFAKGNYYSLAGRAPFSRLIYPVPQPGGLGVHLTLDLGGQARFGPDVEWVEQIDYTVDPRRADAFYAAIRSYWPGLPDGALHPAYAGIRPKLQGPGEAAGDFVIQGPAQHGVAGLVNLFGIESPGLTAAIAIADYVTDLIDAGRAG